VEKELVHCASNDLVGRALRRTDVAGRPIARKVFGLCDAILMQDKTLAELLGGWTMLEQREQRPT
jgi:hypothetical protein